MYVRITHIRWRGIARPWKDIERGPWMTGWIHYSHGANRPGGRMIAQLSFHQEGAAKSARAEGMLYEPTLQSLGDSRMRIRGYERLETETGTAAVLQEWLVEVIQASPPPP